MKAQTLIKIGSSILINKSWSYMVPTVGAEFSYEFGIKPKTGINLICNVHFGGRKTPFDPKIWQKDFMVGFQSEFKYFLTERFKGKYFGCGISLNNLLIKNWIPPTTSDPTPTLESWETHFGVSYGTFIYNKDSKYLFNPFVYIGYNPFEWNEYETRLRIGIMISRIP